MNLGFVSGRMELTDLPPEVLEMIFSYLQLNLQGLLELSMVCRLFRDVARRVPVPVKIPLQDSQLAVMQDHNISVSSLSNREPSMFVKYQIGRLNLRRLTNAQLVAGDYLAKTNRVELSPHYVEILEHLSKFSRNTLRHLMLNVDLVTTCAAPPLIKDSNHTSSETGRTLPTNFRCAAILSRFSNLTFLALHFTQQIELKQRILGRNQDGQDMIQSVVTNLKKLKQLYVFVCPTTELVVHSDTLEKLCIYKSEFVSIKELRTPKLKSLMFHNGLEEFFRKARQDKEMGIKFLNGGLFKVIYQGCPELDFFNTVHVGVLRPHNLTQEQWCTYALRLCVRKYQIDKDFAATYSCVKTNG